MALYEGIAAGGKWSEAGTWLVGGVTPGSPPGEGDDVRLLSTTGAIQIEGEEAKCRSLNCKGYTHILSVAKRLAIGTSTSQEEGIALYLGSGMGLVSTASSVERIRLKSTSATVQKITSEGNNFVEFEIQGSATYQLQDNAVGKLVVLENASCILDLNEKTLSLSEFIAMNSCKELKIGTNAILKIEKLSIQETCALLSSKIKGTGTILFFGSKAQTAQKRVSTVGISNSFLWPEGKIIVEADGITFGNPTVNDTFEFGTLEINTIGKSTTGTRLIGASGEGVQITCGTFKTNSTKTEKISIKGEDSTVEHKELPWRLKKTSGTVEVTGVELRGSHAEGGATFKDLNGVDLGGNTGWAFESTGAPIVVTKSATNTKATTSTLKATINPSGFSVTVHKFEYGETSGYGKSIEATPEPGSGEAAVEVSANISELIPGKTYHYRIVATNTNGTSAGSDETFTTPVESPEVTTQAANNIGKTSGTLNGIINPRGSEITEHIFEYGKTTAYGSTIAAEPPPGKVIEPKSVSAEATPLEKETLYHFRLKAKNAAGTVTGADETFITGGSEQLHYGVTSCQPLELIH